MSSRLHQREGQVDEMLAAGGSKKKSIFDSSNPKRPPVLAHLGSRPPANEAHFDEEMGSPTPTRNKYQPFLNS